MNIGLKNPFKGEASLLNTKGSLPKIVQGEVQLVYPKYKYIQGNSPYCIYIPSSEVMFKLMRSCIGVKEPENVFFFNKGVDVLYRKVNN